MKKTAADDNVDVMTHGQFTVQKDLKVTNDTDRLYYIRSDVQVQVKIGHLFRLVFDPNPISSVVAGFSRSRCDLHHS